MAVPGTPAVREGFKAPHLLWDKSGGGPRNPHILHLAVLISSPVTSCDHTLSGVVSDPAARPEPATEKHDRPSKVTPQPPTQLESSSLARTQQGGPSLSVGK